jgi:hypothetical protein
MQPFVAPKQKINKEEVIKLRKAQAAEAAARANAALAQSGAKPEDAALLRSKDWIKPEDATDRLRIIFDNSGSMQDESKGLGKMQSAKDGVVEFLRNCTPNSTAVAIHLLNPKSNYDYVAGHALALPKHIESAKMTSDIILLASEILDPSIDATGGTPLYETIKIALAANDPVATRLVAFSDGSPQGCSDKYEILNDAKRRGIPIDTVYICDKYESQYSSSKAIAEMKYIAEMTGGIFLDLSKGDIKSGLKYLAPAKRLMLADSSFKAQVERGEVK